MKNNKAPASFFGRLRRVTQIFLFVAELAHRLSLQRIGRLAEPEPGEDSHERQLAKWTKARIIALGTTFIKLGQILSTRADLVSAVWIEELATLQEKVDNPVSFEEVQFLIESELGAPLAELFLDVDPEPFRVASIGVIHRARRLRDGEIVQQVIKVQKPGVAEQVYRDLSILRSIVQHLVFLPRLTKGANLYGLIDELEATFGAELDYRIEAANTELFGRMFSSPESRVRVPFVDRARSAERVLTLDYLPSMKVTEYSGSSEDVQQLASTLIAAFLKQFAVEGVFHADPHPGNLGVAIGPDGRPLLVLYDFGMVGRLSPSMRDSILQIAGSAMKGDVGGLIAHCVAAGMMKPAMLTDADAREVVQRFVSRLDKVSAETIGILQRELFKASENGDFIFPQELTFVGRSLISLEGVLKILQKSSRELKLNRVILSETLPLAARLFAEPINPVERAEFDTERLLKAAGVLAQQSIAFFERAERGQVRLPVHDADTARVVRRLKYGAKSTSAAILFASFFTPGILVMAITDDLFLGLPLTAVSVIFLERWYLAEKRLDN